MKKKSTMIYKTIHRKLKTEQHNSLKIWGQISCSGRVRSSCSISDTYSIFVGVNLHNIYALLVIAIQVSKMVLGSILPYDKRIVNQGKIEIICKLQIIISVTQKLGEAQYHHKRVSLFFVWFIPITNFHLYTLIFVNKMCLHQQTIHVKR